MYQFDHVDCGATSATGAIRRRAFFSLPDTTGFLIRFFDRLAEWQDRADQRRRLLTLDHRMLADIGKDRANAFVEAEKPFWRP